MQKAAAAISPANLEFFKKYMIKGKMRIEIQWLERFEFSSRIYTILAAPKKGGTGN